MRREPSGWGTDDTEANILHVDMDAFYASVELARRPHLRGRPVIVGGDGRSVVLAATYEARAFGVHSALPMAHALRMCPQAIVLPPDLAAYRRVSAEVMETLRAVTSLVEQLSVDEAFLDVRGARRRLGPPSAIGAAIRARVSADHGITCSVGVASTKFVAKLASVHAKPDGMLLIPAEATVPFLRTLPVGALWGVGEKTAQALARYGITRVAELADSDVRLVQTAVGKVAGARLHDLAWGRDPRAVEPTRVEKSIGTETTFEHDQTDPRVVQDTLLRLADKCATRLRAQGLLARTVSLKVRTADFATLTRSHTLVAPTDAARELFLVAREMFGRAPLGGRAVRLVGIRAEGLTQRAETPVQLTLEDAVAEHGDQREAEATIDLVRERFGTAAIRLGAGPRAAARRGTETGLDPSRSDSTTASALVELS